MKSIVERVLKLLDENKSQINIALKEEGREYEFDIKKAKTIINSFKNKKLEGKHKKDIVITNGNPYTTIYVLMKSNLEQNTTVFCTDEKLEKLNKELVRVFNQANEKHLISYKSGIRLRDLYLTIEKRNEIVVDVYDDFDYYYNLLTFGFNANYKSLFSIDLYYDSIDYEDMVSVIEDYAKARYMNLNVFDNKSYEEILLRTNSDMASLSVLILTKEFEKYEGLKKKFIDKKIYINYNPFDNYEENAIKQFIKNNM